MHKTIVTILLLIYSLSSFCQQSIEGMYYQNGGKTFEIRKDSFLLTITESSLSGRLYEPVIVVGKVEQIAPNLLKLNQIDKKNQKEIRIVQSARGRIKDSVQIRFHIPSAKNLTIKLATWENAWSLKYFTLHYKIDKSETIFIPRKKQVLECRIREDDIFTNDIDGRFYGKLEELLALERIKPETDYIDVFIPYIDDAYFYRYHIVNEYARLSGDTIFWKDATFIKNKTSWWDWDSDLD